MGSTKKKSKRVVNLELTALSLAAKKAGMSYGKFIAGLTAEKREIIIREYAEIMNIDDDDSFNLYPSAD